MRKELLLLLFLPISVPSKLYNKSKAVVVAIGVHYAGKPSTKQKELLRKKILKPLLSKKVYLGTLSLRKA